MLKLCKNFYEPRSNELKDGDIKNAESYTGDRAKLIASVKEYGYSSFALVINSPVKCPHTMRVLEDTVNYFSDEKRPLCDTRTVLATWDEGWADAQKAASKEAHSASTDNALKLELPDMYSEEEIANPLGLDFAIGLDDAELLGVDLVPMISDG